MKCLLLSLGLALACGVQAAHIPQTVEDLDIRKVAGTWHPVAMAARDVLLLDARSGPLRVYVEELKPTPEGDLEILLQKRESHECVEKTLMAQKIKDPAVFTVDYCSSYTIFCTGGPVPPDEGSVTCQCLGTWGPCRACPEELRLTETGPLVELTPEVDNEAMEKFAGALASLLEDVLMVLDLRRGAGQCRV